MSKGSKFILIFCGCIFAVIFVISGYKLISTLRGYKIAEETYSNMSSEFVSSKKDGDESDKPVDETKELDPEVCPITVDFDQLLAKGPEIVGWLYSPDTVINYPIAQGEDNDFYLHRFIDGTYNSSGTLFVDVLCQGDFSDSNTLVYGHNMKDSSMFASLLNYASQEYYDAHPKMYLLTPEQNYRVELFAGFVTASDSDIYTIRFDEADKYKDFLNSLRAQSKFNNSVTYTADDKIITLSTCTYDYADARFVVIGKLVAIH